MLSHLSQKACKRLREAGLAASTLTLTIRYAGFDTHTRSKSLGESTALDSGINAVFQELFHKHRDQRRKVRLLGVSLSNFSHGGEQLDLLQAEQREKLQKLTQATDRLRDRFGFSKVQFGGSLRRDDCPKIAELRFSSGLLAIRIQLTSRAIPVFSHAALWRIIAK